MYIFYIFSLYYLWTNLHIFFPRSIYFTILPSVFPYTNVPHTYITISDKALARAPLPSHSLTSLPSQSHPHHSHSDSSNSGNCVAVVTGGGIQVYHTLSLVAAMNRMRNQGQGQGHGQGLIQHNDQGLILTQQSQSQHQHQDKSQHQHQGQGAANGLSVLLPLLVTDHSRQIAALQMISSLLQLSAPALIAFTTPGNTTTTSTGSGNSNSPGLNTPPVLGARPNPSPSPCLSRALLYCLVSTSKDARASGSQGGITTAESLQVPPISHTHPPNHPPIFILRYLLCLIIVITIISLIFSFDLLVHHLNITTYSSSSIFLFWHTSYLGLLTSS